MKINEIGDASRIPRRGGISLDRDESYGTENGKYSDNNYELYEGETKGFSK